MLTEIEVAVQATHSQSTGLDKGTGNNGGHLENLTS